MMELTVYNRSGQEVDKLRVDETVLGGAVRYALLKQAIVMYQANRRQGTVKTKGRSEVAGSDKKLFRQKGTGNARVGNRRTGKRVGGGMIFAKVPRDFRQTMPRTQRRLARDSAVLAKLRKNQVVVVDGLGFEEPRTKEFAGILKNLKIDRSCLVAVKEYDQNLYKSARNVQKVAVLPVADLNAGDICTHQRMLFTKDALVAFLNRDADSES
ncbi:MAG: 50S ribosomal protein L4 [Sedimentisphaerales bacterium]|jgi:large subunit ribosomal protein L4|nr:50S ribosomal protein L4 [Sedimentisphaerales bacterium]NLZ06063.1 50S ribosomal protein L4 [Phycisphaerae bacterium]HNY77231.1 50S ribosomal protein L4 [Sedimentisphaerales bacterium]HOC62165.1 50S ribosomal protein L4 [Sedimentisphaerales bacterium]HOH63448.1 50S ribosomal protein L4 [Sedimentisphaerales bacterium]